jgi:hypothetical protein
MKEGGEDGGEVKKKYIYIKKEGEEEGDILGFIVLIYKSFINI